MVLAVAIFLAPPLLLGGAWDVWFYRALVLLVIACPCALVISTPVTIVAALAGAAKQGVLVKGGTHLETPARLKAIAMDKTGTLRSEEHTSELQSLMRISYAVFCLKKNKNHNHNRHANLRENKKTTRAGDKKTTERQT